jgi:hypothetical protein
MREIRTSGSMSGRWKRGMAWLVRHRQPKGPAPDMLCLNHRATSRLYEGARDDLLGNPGCTGATLGCEGWTPSACAS